MVINGTIAVIFTTIIAGILRQPFDGVEIAFDILEDNLIIYLLFTPSKLTVAPWVTSAPSLRETPSGTLGAIFAAVPLAVVGGITVDAGPVDCVDCCC